jgi:hypothetical protein
MDTGQALVSIKFADGEIILNVAFIFSFDLSSPSGIANQNFFACNLQIPQATLQQEL